MLSIRKIHLEVALNRPENFSTGGIMGKSCCFVMVWFIESHVKQKCLGGGITSSGTALLKPLLPGRWDWSAELLEGDDSAGNIQQLQGNKTEWNNKDMSTRRKGCVAHIPCLGLARVGFLAWSSTISGPELAAVMWYQTGLRQLVGLHLLLGKHSPVLLFHSVDAHDSRSPFSCYLKLISTCSLSTDC